MFHWISNLIEPFRLKSAHRRLLGIIVCLAGLGWSPVCHAFECVCRESSLCCIEAQPWEEANRLFRSDSRWLGGDGATSVDLGNGRVLWLFGDSFVDLSGSGTRKASILVRNSIAVQTGYDPSKAEMEFFWKMDGSQPADFFALAGDSWFWPGSGIMIGKRLLVFLMEIRSAKNDLGFDVSGWKAVLIDNPQTPPACWKLTFLKSPQKQNLIVGSGNPILENGFLHVFAANSKDRSVYLVRWPEHAALAGILSLSQWWAGDQEGWVGPEAAGIQPLRIIATGQMEFSVEYIPQLKSYLQIQTLSYMNPCLAMSTAKTLTGPWSAQACFNTSPEQGVPDNLIYAGKSHPMLHGGGDMVFTYVVNTTNEERLLGDMAIYFPFVLRGRIYDCRNFQKEPH